MFDDSHSFITRAFLRAAFDLDYRAYAADRDAELLKRLRDWDGRLRLSETQAEGAFTQTFFVDTWGYRSYLYVNFDPAGIVVSKLTRRIDTGRDGRGAN